MLHPNPKGCVAKQKKSLTYLIFGFLFGLMRNIIIKIIFALTLKNIKNYQKNTL